MTFLPRTEELGLSPAGLEAESTHFVLYPAHLLQPWGANPSASQTCFPHFYEAVRTCLPPLGVPQSPMR